MCRADGKEAGEQLGQEEEQEAAHELRKDKQKCLDGGDGGDGCVAAEDIDGFGDDDSGSNYIKKINK